MGYIGHSMSERARDAYAGGEKPLSKWAKADIIEAMEGEGWQPESIERAKSMPIAELRKAVLSRSSWHHTGAFYNKTDFYSLDGEASFMAGDDAFCSRMAAEEAEDFKSWLKRMPHGAYWDEFEGEAVENLPIDASGEPRSFRFEWMGDADVEKAFPKDERDAMASRIEAINATIRERQRAEEEKARGVV